MSKAQVEVIAALRIELDATKAALAKAEGARSALAAELERFIKAGGCRACRGDHPETECPVLLVQADLERELSEARARAEKSEAACVARFSESEKELARKLADATARAEVAEAAQAKAEARLKHGPIPGWVSPEAFGRIVAELECPPEVDEVLKEVARLQEAVREDLRGALPCGHPRVLLDRSVESGIEFCAGCRNAEMLRDALHMEQTYKTERDSLREQLAALNGTPQRRFTRIMEELERVLGPHPSPYRSDEVGEEHYLRVIKANAERLGDAEQVIEAAQKLLNAMNYIEGSRAHDLELAITTFESWRKGGK